MTDFIIASSHYRQDSRHFKSISRSIDNEFRRHMKLPDHRHSVGLSAHNRLTARWYDSLKTGNPDYSVYDDDDYWLTLIDCYTGFTSASACGLGLFYKHIGSQPLSILDVYGGLGHASILFSKIFPDANIYLWLGSQNHADYAKQLIKMFNAKNVSIVDSPVVTEVVFAAEVLEHIYKPLDFLNSLIDNDVTSVYVDSSSFNIDGLGHFNEYEINNEIIHRSKAMRVISKNLRQRQWIGTNSVKSQYKIVFWNKVPKIYCKNEK